CSLTDRRAGAGGHREPKVGDFAAQLDERVAMAAGASLRCRGLSFMFFCVPTRGSEDRIMYIDTAMEAARLGGAVLMEHLHGRLSRQASAKLSFDFVTEVDLLAEKAILDCIRRRHPDHRILRSEERRVGKECRRRRSRERE